ncbi:MAG: YhcB family protein [Candidatus Binatia bacterium]
MMEPGSLLSLMSLVVLVVGIAVGLVVGRLTSPAVAEAARLRGEIDRTLREHETYKSSVNSHFRKTADLVGHMTKSYAAVYDHLASGARHFCSDGDSGTQVPFGPLPGALASPVIDGAAEEVGAAGTASLGTSEEAANEPAAVGSLDVAAAVASASEAEAAGESEGATDATHAWPTDVALEDALASDEETGLAESESAPDAPEPSAAETRA